MSSVYKRDLTRGFRTFHISEIYMGEPNPTGESLFVPNPNDIVVDQERQLHSVVSVDPETAIPTLERITIPTGYDSRVRDPNDLNIGLQYYTPSIINRIFVDDTTTPNTAVVDTLYNIKGSEATRAVLFLGSDTSENGTVLSTTPTGNGGTLTADIALEDVGETDNTVQRPVRFNISQNLNDGELVSLAVYSANDFLIAVHPFVIVNANMVSGPIYNGLHVQAIELLSDLIDSNNATVLNNPLNTPLYVENMSARIHYSNGTHIDRVIDGNRVALHGVSGFNTNVPSARANLVLTYYPSVDEAAVNTGAGNVPSVSKLYTVINQHEQLADIVPLKVYVVPVYDSNGYRLTFRLTNMSYTLDKDVTDYVNYQRVDGTPFVGSSYDLPQTVVATVNLDGALPGTYPGRRHTQSFTITLKTPNTPDTNDWIIDYGNDTVTHYGLYDWVVADTTGNRMFNINPTYATLEDWTSRLYRGLDPIYDQYSMAGAPEPTHFKLEHDGVAIGTYPIANYANMFELGADRDWVEGKPLNIVWLTTSSGVYLTLGVTALSLKLAYV